MCWDGLTTEMCWAEVINTVGGCCIGLLHNDESVSVTLRYGLGMVTGRDWKQQSWSISQLLALQYSGWTGKTT